MTANDHVVVIGAGVSGLTTTVVRGEADGQVGVEGTGQAAQQWQGGRRAWLLPGSSSR